MNTTLTQNLPAWMRTAGFRRWDLDLFGRDIRVSGTCLQLAHRDAAGYLLGWESTWQEGPRRFGHSYTYGMPKGLIRSANADASRLVICGGPATVLACAAVLTEIAPDVPTLYAAPGGAAGMPGPPRSSRLCWSNVGFRKSTRRSGATSSASAPPAWSKPTLRGTPRVCPSPVSFPAAEAGSTS